MIITKKTRASPSIGAPNTINSKSIASIYSTSVCIVTNSDPKRGHLDRILSFGVTHIFCHVHINNNFRMRDLLVILFPAWSESTKQIILIAFPLSVVACSRIFFLTTRYSFFMASALSCGDASVPIGLYIMSNHPGSITIHDLLYFSMYLIIWIAWFKCPIRGPTMYCDNSTFLCKKYTLPKSYIYLIAPIRFW